MCRRIGSCWPWPAGQFNKDGGPASAPPARPPRLNPDMNLLEQVFDMARPRQDSQAMHIFKFAGGVFGLAFCLVLPARTAAAPFDPPALYLQWQRDPTTTMTIHWHTEGPARTELGYRPRGGTNWATALGSAQLLAGTERWVHAVELTGLTAATDYEFHFEPDGTVYKFRTMPKDLSQPVRFITGGDVYHELKWMNAMNVLAARLDPAFVVLGGDLAYSNGGTNEEKIARWFDYFAAWKTNAIAPDGRLIPMLVTLGNHEVKGSYRQPVEKAASFYTLFSAPGPQGYTALDFGKYLSLFLLDSDHTHPIAGEQTAWLGKNLAARRAVPHVIPFYHTPSYPGFREADGTQAREVRANWCPLFDKYGVKLVFENHDHCFKRTFPIRAGKLDPAGTTYLGDGAWGVALRKPDPAKPKWYIAKSGDIRHLYLVTLYPEARHVLAINEAGQVFDEVYQRVK